MNPNAVNRVAIAATISAVVLSIAVVAGSRRSHQQMAATPVAVEVALTEERAAADMARAEAEMARAEALAERAAVEADRVAEMQTGVPVGEEEDAEATDREEDLNKIRQAAKDYVKNALPDTKSDGVFLLPLYQDSLFIAGVDTQLPDGKRKTIDLLVRRYVRKGSNNYWRAESLEGGQNTLIKTKK